MESAKVYPLNRSPIASSGAIKAPVMPPKPKLLDQVRQAIRTRHYSYRTEKAYVHWIKRSIFFTTNVIRWKWAKRKSHNFFRALLVTRM